MASVERDGMRWCTEASGAMGTAVPCARPGDRWHPGPAPRRRRGYPAGLTRMTKTTGDNGRGGEWREARRRELSESHETVVSSTGQRVQGNIWQKSVLGKGTVLTGDREGSWLSGQGLAPSTVAFWGRVCSVTPRSPGAEVTAAAPHGAGAAGTPGGCRAQGERMSAGTRKVQTTPRAQADSRGPQVPPERAWPRRGGRDAALLTEGRTFWMCSGDGGTD